jgi:hypothetical protein
VSINSPTTSKNGVHPVSSSFFCFLFYQDIPFCTNDALRRIYAVPQRISSTLK